MKTKRSVVCAAGAVFIKGQRFALGINPPQKFIFFAKNGRGADAQMQPENGTRQVAVGFGLYRDKLTPLTVQNEPVRRKSKGSWVKLIFPGLVGT